MRVFTIILAAGKGERFGSKIPKCYIKIKGKPVITYSIEKLSSSDLICVATPPAEEKIFKKTMKILQGLGLKYAVVYGGKTRWESFLNCFSEIKEKFSITEEDILIEHDGARPLFSIQMVKKLIRTLEDINADGVIPVIKPVETVRLIEREEEGENEKRNESEKEEKKKNGKIFLFQQEFDRGKVALVQTPQVFRAKRIYEILEEKKFEFRNLQFTDLAGAVLASGGKIVGIEGERQNIKITFPHDILLVKSLLPFYNSSPDSGISV